MATPPQIRNLLDENDFSEAEREFIEFSNTASTADMNRTRITAELIASKK